MSRYLGWDYSDPSGAAFAMWAMHIFLLDLAGLVGSMTAFGLTKYPMSNLFALCLTITTGTGLLLCILRWIPP